jgi:hypothetical protein
MCPFGRPESADVLEVRVCVCRVASWIRSLHWNSRQVRPPEGPPRVFKDLSRKDRAFLTTAVHMYQDTCVHKEHFGDGG